MLHEPIALDVNHMMSDVIGFQYGIDPCQVDGMKDAAMHYRPLKSME